MSKTAKIVADLIESGIVGELDHLDAKDLVDIATTNWDEEARSLREQHEDHFGPGGQCSFQRKVNEVDLVQIMWKRLPPRIKGQVDMKKLKTFVEYLEGGDNLASSAKAAKIPTATAIELMSAIEKMGLL